MLLGTRNAELDACRSRITNTKRDTDSLSIGLNQSLKKKHHIESQLSQAKTQHVRFETLVAQKRSESQQKTRYLQNLTTKATALNTDCEAAISRISKAESAISQKRSEIQPTKDRISQILDKIESLDAKIQNLGNELRTNPRPQPRTQRIPAKCKNGVVNCKNHPNYGAKTITTNKADIDRYDNKDDELSRLLEDRDKLSDELNNLRSKLSRLNNSLSQEQSNLSEAQRQKNAKTSEIEENTKLQQTVRQESQSLNQEVSDAEGQVSSLNNQINSLTQQELQENDLLATTQDRLKRLTLETQRLTGDEVRIQDRLRSDRLQSEQQLRALAVRQLAIQRLVQQKLMADKSQIHGPTGKNNDLAPSSRSSEPNVASAATQSRSRVERTFSEMVQNTPPGNLFSEDKPYTSTTPNNLEVGDSRNPIVYQKHAWQPLTSFSPGQPQVNSILGHSGSSQLNTSSDRKPASALRLIPTVVAEVVEAATGLAVGAAVTKRFNDQTQFIMEHTNELYDKIQGPSPSVEQNQRPFRTVSTLPVQTVPNASTVTPWGTWGTAADTSTTTVSQPGFPMNTFTTDPVGHKSVKERVEEIQQQHGDSSSKTPSGKRLNVMKPLPEAQGTSHTTIKFKPGTGKVSNYETWTPNPRNPEGYDTVKRVDTQHAKPHTDHGVETPHVHLKGKGLKMRPARPEELPNN